MNSTLGFLLSTVITGNFDLNLGKREYVKHEPDEETQRMLIEKAEAKRKRKLLKKQHDEENKSRT